MSARLYALEEDGKVVSCPRCETYSFALAQGHACEGCGLDRSAPEPGSTITERERRALEKAALKAMCSFSYWDMADIIESLPDADLRAVIANPHYFHEREGDGCGNGNAPEEAA